MLAFSLLPCSLDSNECVSDKAKPRAIVGRKATGPLGIAGLPKREIQKGPWSVMARAFFDLSGNTGIREDSKKEGGEKIKGAGCGKDTRTIPACEDARSALLSRDFILALFILFPLRSTKSISQSSGLRSPCIWPFLISQSKWILSNIN